MRVLFTTVALPGHFFPLVPLAKAFLARGHEVLVATSDGFTPVVRTAGLPVAGCGPAADFVSLSRNSPSGLGERAYANGIVFGRIAGAVLGGMTGLARRWRPDLVISERAEFAGPIVAQRLGIRSAELQWGVAELPEYRLAATAVLGQEPARSEVVLNPWPPSLRLPHAKNHRGVRHEPFDGTDPLPASLREPAKAPRVCVTLGTVLPHLGVDQVVDVVLPLLEHLARLGVELVVAVDDRIAARWPPLPRAVRYAGRVPLARVLAGCAAIVHHGGQGTGLTAFQTGLPQLALPQFDDQYDNAAAVVTSGSGLCLLPEDITPKAVAAHCRRLLTEPEFAAGAARVAAEIAAQPASGEVAEMLEFVTNR